MPLPTTPQVSRLEAATSLPKHPRCWDLDDVFTKFCHPQWPMLGAFEPLGLSFLSGHLHPQWLPGGVACVRIRPLAWVLPALDIQPMLAPAIETISKCGFPSRTACICCHSFFCRQVFDQRPRGLRPTRFVSPPPLMPLSLPFSRSFPQPS